jgi:purine-nucleoside phosphorylase
VALATGVYMWFSGPSFETPAEIRMARLLGADAVGMSTAPEIILGRFFGLRCAAVSTVVNFAAGMTGAEITHAETKALAPIGAAKLARIVRRYLRDRRSRHR